MKNFVQPGEVVTATLGPASGIKSGDGVLLRSLFGVAAVDAPAAGGEIEIAVSGVFDLAKSSGAGTALAGPGAPAYFDAVAGKVTGIAAGSTLIGIALATAGDSAVVARVRLNGFAGLNSDAGVAADIAALQGADTSLDGRITALEEA